MAGGRLEAGVQPRALTRSGLGGDGRPWRIGTEVYGDRDILPKDITRRKLSVPNAGRVFFIRHALRPGFTIEEIFNLRWPSTAFIPRRRATAPTGIVLGK
ncbi:MAG: hypothetical protein ABSF10_06825 [Verrucomicrobiota bacterium]